ncbi:MAG: low molecular weight protein-tyrosine-phosphatase [Streptosporangiaceae bacterium]
MADRSFEVLVICSGNTCRSPMSVRVLREFLQRAGMDRDVTAASAGLAVAVPGGPADPRAVAALAARGYGGVEHRARQFEPAMLTQADLVIGLDSGHQAELRRIAARTGTATPIRLLRSARLADAGPGSGPVGALDVPDPFAGSLGDYLRTLDLIEAAMPDLLAVIRDLTGR